MSLPMHKVETLIREGRIGARILKQIKKNNDRLLIAGLICNNLVNVFIASLATKISIDMAKSAGIEQWLALWISTGLVTFLILMFWEICPKSFSLKNAEMISLLSAYPYKFLLWALHPCITIFEHVIKLLTGKWAKISMSFEDVKSFMEIGKKSGVLEHNVHEKILWILDMSDITVEEIMVPRVQIKSINDELNVDQAVQHFLEHSKTRIPIYDQNPDNIYGFVTVGDILKEIHNGNKERKLKTLNFKKATKIPLNQPINKVLELFQKSHKHMAIVIDEYGGVAGIVTLEDVMEEVFWEIRDEKDNEHDEITCISEHKYLVDPAASMEDLLEEFDLNYEEIGLNEDSFDGETVSYILTDTLERFPNQGEVVAFPIKIEDHKYYWKKLTFQILEMTEGKIGRVEVNLA